MVATATEGAPLSPADDAAEYAGTLFDPTDTANDKFVRVSRWDPKGAKWDFQFRIAPEQATEELLQEYLGGGRFKCIVFKRNARGHFEYEKARQVSVGGAPKPLTRLPGDYRPGAPPGVPMMGQAGAPVMAAADPGITFDKIMTAGVLDLFKMSREASMATVDAVRQLRTPDGDGGGMSKVLEMIVANQAKADASQARMFDLVIAMINKPAPAAPVTDPLLIVDRMAALMKPSQSLKDQIESLNGLYELKDRINPVGEPEDPIVRMVEANLPRVLAVIEKMGSAPAAGGVVTPKAPALNILPRPPGAPTPTAAAPTAPATGETEDEQMRFYLARKLPILVLWAQRDKDPEVLAAAEFQLLPDVLRGPLRTFLTDPDVLAKIVAVAPALAPYAGPDAWLDRFVTELQGQFGLLEEDTDEGEDAADESNRGGAAPAAGDAGEAAGKPGPAA